MEKLEKLNSHVADETQYLIVKYHDGTVLHKKGYTNHTYNDTF